MARCFVVLIVSAVVLLFLWLHMSNENSRDRLDHIMQVQTLREQIRVSDSVLAVRDEEEAELLDTLRALRAEHAALIAELASITSTHRSTRDALLVAPPDSLLRFIRRHVAGYRPFDAGQPWLEH